MQHSKWKSSGRQKYYYYFQNMITKNNKLKKFFVKYNNVELQYKKIKYVYTNDTKGINS